MGAVKIESGNCVKWPGKRENEVSAGLIARARRRIAKLLRISQAQLIVPPLSRPA